MIELIEELKELRTSSLSGERNFHIIRRAIEAIPVWRPMSELELKSTGAPERGHHKLLWCRMKLLPRPEALGPLEPYWTEPYVIKCLWYPHRGPSKWYSAWRPSYEPQEAYLVSIYATHWMNVPDGPDGVDMAVPL